MAKFLSPRLECLTVISVLLTGVMAETLDSALIGVAVAGVCVALLIIVIIAFIAFCCFRRIETNRKTVLVRKDSGSVSTANGIAPRWVPSMVPSGMPAYSVPAEPVMYAVPASHYYLGHYAPKFIDAETMEYMRTQSSSQRQKTEDQTVERQHMRHSDHVMQGDHLMQDDHVMQGDHVMVSDHVIRTDHVIQQTQEQQEMTIQRETSAEVTQAEEPPQPNGNVVNEFSASSLNYKDTDKTEGISSKEETEVAEETGPIIRKQHKHEKMPEWLRKSYGEDGKTLTLEDEVSMSSSEGELVIPPTPEEVVRAEVSPHHSFLDSDNILSIPQGFTIVDYVDPDGRPRPSHRLQDSSSMDQQRVTYVTDSEIASDVTNTAMTNFNTTTDVTSTSDVTKDVTVSGNKRITVTTTTTTLYSSAEARGGAEVVQAEDSSYVVAPASTSTPRPPPRLPTPPPSPPPPPLPMPQETDVASLGSGDLSHFRMRQAGDGSLTDLPAAIASADGFN